MMSGAEGRKSDIIVLEGGFLTLEPGKNMKKQPGKGGF